MYNVTENYITQALSEGRVYTVQLVIYKARQEETDDIITVINSSDILSMKIIRGRTSGGFMLGNTICSSLETKLANSAQIKTGSYVQARVRFGENENITEWQSLGFFYVDSIDEGQFNKSVTAYDAMLQLSRVYKSELDYPAKMSAVLNEISKQAKVKLSENLDLLNDDIDIIEAPRSKDEHAYYTRREILGYIASANGGSACIDIDGRINIFTPKNTNYTIYSKSVTKQKIQDASYTINDIVWDTLGRSLSVGDDDVEGVVDVYNPLSFASEDDIVDNLKEKLIDLSYDTLTITKQGTGLFQLGDLVDYTTVDGEGLHLLITGIIYDFSNGFFFETLYSMAQSVSQQQNQGNKVKEKAPLYDDAKTPSSNIKNNVIINSANIVSQYTSEYLKYNYTVLPFETFPIAYGGSPQNPVICRGWANGATTYSRIDSYTYDKNGNILSVAWLLTLELADGSKETIIYATPPDNPNVMPDNGSVILANVRVGEDETNPGGIVVYGKFELSNGEVKVTNNRGVQFMSLAEARYAVGIQEEYVNTQEVSQTVTKVAAELSPGSVPIGGGGTSDVSKAYVDAQDSANLETAKAYTDTKVGAVIENVLANSEDIAVIQSDVEAIDAKIDNVQTEAELYTDVKTDALDARITANENAISTLNGTGEGSVKKAVSDGIAEVVADAPEEFDTLKEMSNWIAGHEDSAAAMNAAIQDNTTDIAALQAGKADKDEIPTTLPANGGNANTVNGHTVNADVPTDAKFTDTTYAVMTGATDTANGTAGLVPEPTKSNKNEFLTGSGAWSNPFAANRVTEDSDLNDYKTGGIYWFTSSTNLENIPDGLAGWLLVLSTNPGNQVKQLWFRYGATGSNTFVREYNSSSKKWTEWHKFAVSLASTVSSVNTMFAASADDNAPN